WKFDADAYSKNICVSCSRFEEITDTSGSHTSSEIDCDLVSNSCSDDGSDEDVLQQLEVDMVVCLQYYPITERMVRQYLVSDRAHRYLFPTTRNGHKMLQNMHV
ncbi:Hypothetical predicted protein, partial [Olea europaea subsp. europaea]